MPIQTNELITTLPMQQINATELLHTIGPNAEARHLGVPIDVPIPADLRRKIDMARTEIREKANIWIGTNVVDVSGMDESTIRLGNDVLLTSSIVAAGFRKAAVDRAAVLGISLGPAIDGIIKQHWSDGRPDDAMTLHASAAAVVEHLRDAIRLHLQAEHADIQVLPHYSPGYPEWHLSDQIELLAAIQDNTHPITVLESGGLTPTYSTLAIIGFARDLDTSAKKFSWPSSATVTGKSQPLPERTLAKWAKERLTLEALPEDRIRASFDFEGTTCTNMGTTMAFRYDLTVSRRAAGRLQIERATTTPREGHAGHAGHAGHRMSCAFQQNPSAFLSGVDLDVPAIGDTTDMVLNSYLSASSSACLCTADNRKHKWRLVLETLHYALGIDDVIT